MQHMQSKSTWMVALAAVALALSTAVPARDLTVVSWGGAYQDAQREVYFKPFMEKSKIKMAEENWDGGVGTLRAKVQGGNNNWDVVQVESEELHVTELVISLVLLSENVPVAVNC